MTTKTAKSTSAAPCLPDEMTFDNATRPTRPKPANGNGASREVAKNGLYARLTENGVHTAEIPAENYARLGEEGPDNSPSPAPVSRLIPLDQIAINPHQPRKVFAPVPMEELIASVKARGVLDPIAVRPKANQRGEERYEIVKGERRYRAAKAAGLAHIPALVIEADNKTAYLLAMIENKVRDGFKPIEYAQAIEVLMNHYGLSAKEIAGEFGGSESSVNNTKRLLRLPSRCMKAVDEGVLRWEKEGETYEVPFTEGHARPLIPFADINEPVIHQILNKLQADVEAGAAPWTTKRMERECAAHRALLDGNSAPEPSIGNDLVSARNENGAPQDQDTIVTQPPAIRTTGPTAPVSGGEGGREATGRGGSPTGGASEESLARVQGRERAAEALTALNTDRDRVAEIERRHKLSDRLRFALNTGRYTLSEQDVYWREINAEGGMNRMPIDKLQAWVEKVEGDFQSEKPLYAQAEPDDKEIQAAPAFDRSAAIARILSLMPTLTEKKREEILSDWEIVEVTEQWLNLVADNDELLEIYLEMVEEAAKETEAQAKNREAAAEQLAQARAKVDHFQALADSAKTADERRRYKADARSAESVVEFLQEKGIPDLLTLAYWQYQNLAVATNKPADCTEECPCRVTATRLGRECAACLDPDRFRRLHTLDTRKANEALREQAEKLYPSAVTALHNLDPESRSQIAAGVLGVVALMCCLSEDIRKGAFAIGLKIAPKQFVGSTALHERAAQIKELSVLPADQVLSLALHSLLARDIRMAADSYQGGSRFTQGIIDLASRQSIAGKLASAKPAAPSNPPKREAPGDPSAACSECGDPISEDQFEKSTSEAQDQNARCEKHHAAYVEAL